MTADPFAGVTDVDERLVEFFRNSMKNVPPDDAPLPDILEMRRQQGEPEIPGAVKRSIPGPAGPIELMVVTPERIDGVYLHIHGGGWSGGRGCQHEVETAEFAKRYSVAVVNVRYRLAPENPYPAGPDDCEAAAAWVIEHALGEFGTDRIVIGGESAGAHLSAVTLLRMRDRHGFTGFAGAELLYGCYDLRLTPSVRSHPYPFLNRRMMEWATGMFVASSDRTDPDLSPIFADLRDMPPALFTIGTYDSLLDDSLFMWTRWRAAGNDAELDIYPGGWHGFDNTPNEMGRRAKEKTWRFIAERLGVAVDAAAPAG